MGLKAKVKEFMIERSINGMMDLASTGGRGSESQKERCPADEDNDERSDEKEEGSFPKSRAHARNCRSLVRRRSGGVSVINEPGAQAAPSGRSGSNRGCATGAFLGNRVFRTESRLRRTR